MTDMQGVIVPKSDQINADDLIAGPITVKIESVRIKAGEDQPVSIALVGTKKVYRPCKSMSRVLVAAWGPDSKSYAGRSLTLYRDPTVRWGGLEVGGIRISHMSHLGKSINMALTVTRGNRKPYRVLPLGEQAAGASAPPPASDGDDLPASGASLRIAVDLEAPDWRAWATKFDAALLAAVDIAGLAELHKANVDLLDKLLKAYPAAGKKRVDALNARREELERASEFGADTQAAAE